MARGERRGEPLTEFQEAALRAAGRGLTGRQVAAALGRTAGSVRRAQECGRRKLGARTTTEAVATLEGLTRSL